MTVQTKLIAALTLFAASLAPAHAGVQLVNGGFETGTTSGWTVSGTDGTGCGQNFTVSSSGSAAGCTGYPPIPQDFIAPHSGSYAAYAAFDGNGPVNHTLIQTFAVPVGTGGAILSWFDAVGFGAGYSFSPRVYSVSLLDSQNATVADLFSQSYSMGGNFQGWTQRTVDISSYLPGLAGQEARLKFNLYIPENLTGPGAFGLDDVAITEVPEPGSLALLVLGLGLFGAGFARRPRKA